MGLSQRLDSLSLEVGPPSFTESLALAMELQNQRQPPLDQQLAVCRALVRSLPAAVPSGAAGQLVLLASVWLTAGSAGSGKASLPHPLAVQLQTAAAHLFLAMFAVPRVKLQSGACRQLLQQLCQLCRPIPVQQQQPSSVAAMELACACMDLLAQLPQWYPQPTKAELAAAVAATAAALERVVSGAGAGGGSAGVAEAPATTRLLCKLLKALQVILAEAKKDHGANAGSLALVLQRLFTYGWQQRGGGASSGASTPKRSSSALAAPACPGPAATAAASTVGSAPASPALPSPNKYRPPHARRAGTAPAEAPPEHAAATHQSTFAAHRRATGSDSGVGLLALESSDSEGSDAESVGGGGGRERHHAGRVRSSALACLQLLAKADPKSLHASWTALLPTSDVVGSRSAPWGPSVRSSAGGAASVAHVLLLDPQHRVRHAAAATLTTLLEGPAQRAYLAVAEARGLERQPVRGFITLSASLGQVLVALHHALLHSVHSEPDPLVLASTLRALGTLLLGAPYHRLPPHLLPACVQGLLACLASATPACGLAALPPEQLPVASACLACLAAAFSIKAAAAALEHRLLAPPANPPPSHVGSEHTAPGSEASCGSGKEQLLPLLFAYASCQRPALQLEAVMALRGVAQQHAALLADCWERLLVLGRAGATLPPPAPQSPRTSQQGAGDGTVAEKVAQQSVRLPGDYLESTERQQAASSRHQAAPPSCTTAGSPVSPSHSPLVAPALHLERQASNHTAAMSTAAVAAEAAAVEQQAAAQQWEQVAGQVLAPAVQHSSPLLRAAAQAVIAALSPAAFATLPQPVQQRLLGWCCASAAADDASPVRAAAAKAVGTLAASPALCLLPNGPAQVLAALAATCRDGVLAVRIPAAASLADFCAMLSQAACQAPAQVGSVASSGSSKQTPREMSSVASAIVAGVLPACFHLAVAATGDSDKLRPSGLQALGSLTVLHAHLASGLGQQAQQQQQLGQQPEHALMPAPEWRELEQLVAAGAEGVRQCLASSSARVQWAACEAAGQLLSCPGPQGQPHWSPLLDQLLHVLQDCPNFRSRALAAAALRQLGTRWQGRTALPLHSLVAVLDKAASVLFNGKASGFVVVPAAGPQTLHAQQGQHTQLAQQAQRSEPTDLGSKTQLEAALVACVLHLLSLLPAAAVAEEASASDSRHAAAAQAGCRCSAQLRELVQQAQHDLSQSQGLDHDPVTDQAAAASFGSAGLFDFSLVPLGAAPAASAGLACLQ